MLFPSAATRENVTVGSHSGSMPKLSMGKSEVNVSVLRRRAAHRSAACKHSMCTARLDVEGRLCLPP